MATKLHLPVPSARLVSRPRLLARLDEGLRCRLTLISAPAGFGKTTLLSEWIAGSKPDDVVAQYRVAWLSLDENDNDPIRFWSYVIAALQSVGEGVGESVLAALRTAPSAPPVETILTSLVNDIVECDLPPFVLVLDDFHLIEHRSVCESLFFLVNHLPPQMHLLVSSRTDPDLPLARLRAQGQILEIREADLRFTHEEITIFLTQVMGLVISGEDILTLEARTEGWIAGLHLAALSMQEREAQDISSFVNTFTGTHRYVLDYLVEEVLQRQPEQVKSFLFQTAILDRLNNSLCDALTGRNDAQLMLESLDGANLFIVPLDNVRCWYRYHHLFSDLLRDRLNRLQPMQVSVLHTRASQWYERNGFVEDAIDHALQARDFERAVNLIEKEVLARIQVPAWWLEALPEAILRTRPLLCAAHAAILIPSRPRLDKLIETRLQEAEHVLDERKREPDVGQDAYYDLAMGFTLALRALIALTGGDYSSTIRLSLLSLARLPENALAIRSYTYRRLGSGYQGIGDGPAAGDAYAAAARLGFAGGVAHRALGSIELQGSNLIWQGHLDQAEKLYRDTLGEVVAPMERERRLTADAGMMHIGLGRILLERNELEEAACHLEAGVKLFSLTPTVSGCKVVAYSALTRLKRAQRDWAGALAAIATLEQIAPQFARNFAAWRIQLGLEQNNRIAGAAVNRWMQACDLDLSDKRARKLAIDVVDDSFTDYLSLARMHLVQHRTVTPSYLGVTADTQGQAQVSSKGLLPVLQFLTQTSQAALEAGWKDRAITLLILQSLVHQARAELEPSLKALRQAISLAEPAGYVRVFLDEGLPMRALLRQAAFHGIAPDYVARLLAMFKAEAGGQDQIEKTSGSPLIEPLTARELQVLQLIAAGHSNQEIAEILLLAIGTVKRHISNIYAKLNVEKRTQAVACARELDLI